MIPQKQKQFSTKKEICNRRPWYHEIFYVLPNGKTHGLRERYEKYHRPNTPGDLLERQLVLTANYNNGEKDGLESNYEPFTKRIAWQSNFKNGLLHGVRTHFFEDGSVSSLEEYVNGKRVGKTIKYHRDGSIKSECSYNENGNGKIHGTFIENSSNGEIKTIEYVDGIKHGLEFVKDQNSLSWTNWVNDRRHGERIVYNELGQVVLHEIWSDGSMIESIVAPPQKVFVSD
jgi:antitoxin component YwqK of YwqJK toxin-antitoxin module